MNYQIESRNNIRCPETIEKVGTSIPRELNESMDFKLKHETIKQRVIQLLKQDKYARTDDFFLCLLYWVKSGHIKLIVPLEDFSKIHKPESISRCRREIYQEIREGKYPELKYIIDKDTEEIRSNNETLYHDYYQDKKSSKEAELLK